MSAWKHLRDAPQDGSWVAIREQFGTVDHVTRARWVDYDPPDGEYRPMRRCGWLTHDGHVFVCDTYLTWRPLAATEPKVPTRA